MFFSALVFLYVLAPNGLSFFQTIEDPFHLFNPMNHQKEETENDVSTSFDSVFAFL